MQKKNRYGLTLAFWIALIGVLAIVVLSLIFPNAFERLTASIRASISVNFGWFYLLSTLGLKNIGFNNLADQFNIQVIWHKQFFWWRIFLIIRNKEGNKVFLIVIRYRYQIKFMGQELT